jgi:hypothetical protein
MHIAREKMRGGAVFLAFFIFFTSATSAVPVPLFPGNTVRFIYDKLSIPTYFYTPIIDALVNGVVYGFVVWITFLLVSRKIEEAEAAFNSR